MSSFFSSISGLSFIPESYLSKFTLSDFRIFKKLLQIHDVSKKKKKHAQVIPSERWVSVKLGTSERTVSRSVRHLHKLNFLNVKQRRHKNGRFTTNHYGIGWAFHLILERARKAYNEMGLHRTPKLADIVLKDYKEVDHDDQRQKLKALLDGLPP